MCRLTSVADLMLDVRRPGFPGRFVVFFKSILCLFFCFFALSCVVDFGVFLHWHDRQRLAQIFLIFICALYSLFFLFSPFSRLVSLAGMGVLCLGGLSAFLSRYEVWAFYELTVFLGLFLVFMVVRQCVLLPESGSFFILLCLAFVGVANSFQFLVAYGAAVINASSDFDAYLLFSGFSNPRSLNQFQAFVIPVLGFLFFYYKEGAFFYSRLVVSCLGIGLVLQWVVAFSLGGRGLWLSLFLSYVMLGLFFSHHYRLLVVQIVSGVAGWLLYYVLFFIVPSWLDATPEVMDSFRSGLSARDVIWRMAWEIFRSNPWLGAGPMHFSAYVNDVAAHPHQVVLQFLSEWGGVATVMAIACVGYGMLSGLQVVRRAESSALDAVLWMSLFNALMLAQVNGVFVMPYTQTWLAIFAGLACSRWQVGVEYGYKKTVVVRVLAFFVLSACLYLLLIEVPERLRIEHSVGMRAGDFFPRFWSDGFISSDY